MLIIMLTDTAGEYNVNYNNTNNILHGLWYLSVFKHSYT